MKVLLLGICHEIFSFGKKRSKIRVRIIHRRALYTGKYGSCKLDEMISSFNIAEQVMPKLDLVLEKLGTVESKLGKVDSRLEELENHVKSVDVKPRLDILKHFRRKWRRL